MRGPPCRPVGLASMLDPPYATPPSQDSSSDGTAWPRGKSLMGGEVRTRGQAVAIDADVNSVDSPLFKSIAGGLAVLSRSDYATLRRKISVLTALLGRVASLLMTSEARTRGQAVAIDVGSMLDRCWIDAAVNSGLPLLGRLWSIPPLFKSVAGGQAVLSRSKLPPSQAIKLLARLCRLFRYGTVAAHSRL